MVVQGSNKFQGTFIDRLGLSQEEGGGELRISSVRQGPSRDFFGFEMFDFGILWGTKKYYKLRLKPRAIKDQKSKTTLFKNNKKLYLILQPRAGNTYTDCFKNASKIKFKSTETERICLASHLFIRLFKPGFKNCFRKKRTLFCVADNSIT